VERELGGEANARPVRGGRRGLFLSERRL